MIKADILLLARYGLLSPNQCEHDSVTVQRPAEMSVSESRDVIEFAEFMLGTRSFERQ